MGSRFLRGGRSDSLGSASFVNLAALDTNNKTNNTRAT